MLIPIIASSKIIKQNLKEVLFIFGVTHSTKIQNIASFKIILQNLEGAFIYLLTQSIKMQVFVIFNTIVHVKTVVVFILEVIQIIAVHNIAPLKIILQTILEEQYL
jgi:hypothetical protein